MFFVLKKIPDDRKKTAISKTKTKTKGSTRGGFKKHVILFIAFKKSQKSTYRVIAISARPL